MWISLYQYWGLGGDTRSNYSGRPVSPDVSRALKTREAGFSGGLHTIWALAFLKAFVSVTVDASLAVERHFLEERHRQNQGGALFNHRKGP